MRRVVFPSTSGGESTKINEININALHFSDFLQKYRDESEDDFNTLQEIPGMKDSIDKLLKIDPKLDQYEIPKGFGGNIKKLFKPNFDSEIDKGDLFHANDISVWSSLLLLLFNPNPYGFYESFNDNKIVYESFDDNEIVYEKDLQVQVRPLNPIETKKQKIQSGNVGYGLSQHIPSTPVMVGGAVVRPQAEVGRNGLTNACFSGQTLQATSVPGLFFCSLPRQTDDEQLGFCFDFMKNVFGINDIISQQGCALASNYYHREGLSPGHWPEGHRFSAHRNPSWANCQYPHRGVELTVSEKMRLDRIQDRVWEGRERTTTEIIDWRVEGVREIFNVDTERPHRLWNIIIPDMESGNSHIWHVLLAYYIKHKIYAEKSVCVHCWGGWGRTGAKILFFLLLDSVEKNDGWAPWVLTSPADQLVQDVEGFMRNNLKPLSQVGQAHAADDTQMLELLDREANPETTVIEFTKISDRDSPNDPYVLRLFISRINLIFRLVAVFSAIRGRALPWNRYIREGRDIYLHSKRSAEEAVELSRDEGDRKDIRRYTRRYTVLEDQRMARLRQEEQARQVAAEQREAEERAAEQSRQVAAEQREAEERAAEQREAEERAAVQSRQVAAEQREAEERAAEQREAEERAAEQARLEPVYQIPIPIPPIIAVSPPFQEPTQPGTVVPLRVRGPRPWDS